MQCKSSKNRNGRSANSDEKKFHSWVKDQPCAWCGCEGPSIVDHCRGSKFGHNKVHIGHWFVIPQCVACDTQKTIHGKRLGNEAQRWAWVIAEYGEKKCPEDVFISIKDFDK